MEKVLVYGVGKFFEDNKECLWQKYEVVGYVDKNAVLEKMDVFKEIGDVTYNYDKVIIMVSQINVCFEIIMCLLENGIKAEEIILGFMLCKENVGFSNAYVLPNGKICLEKENVQIAISTEDEYQNVKDTLVMECYKYYLQSDKKEVVFDVGMNIGDASLFFLEMEKVEKVYGFEPFFKTYNDALDNITRYGKSERIEIYNYGLSDCNERREILYDMKMSCGQSTISDINNIARKSYDEWGLLSQGETEIESIEVRKSSEIFGELMNRHKDFNFVLKIDCEGEEYRIFHDLAVSGIINKFSFIMMEWHYRTEQELLATLKNNGFSYFSVKKSMNPALGLIYAWKA